MIDLEWLYFDVCVFLYLEELIIGNNCFKNVNTFSIDGLNELKIGVNSFTHLKSNDNWNDDKAKNWNR